jgi:hypothetical protein
MLNKTLIVSTGALLLGSGLIAAEKLDKGGVSIDFSKVKPPTAATTGPNLLQNGSFENVDAQGNPAKKGQWVRSWHVHSLPNEKKQAIALKKKGNNLAITSTTTDNPAQGKRCAVISTSPKVHKMRSDTKNGQPMISNGFGYNVKLPKNGVPGKYNLSFMLRGKTAKGVPGLNKFVVVLSVKGGSEKIWKCKVVGKQLVKHFGMTGAWQRTNLSFLAPKGATYVSFYLKLYGCGEAFVDDVQLRSAKMVEGVTIKIIPMSFLDNTFCLAQGKPAMIGFCGKNEAGVKITKPFLRVKLPAEVKLIGVRDILKIVEKKNVTENGKKYIQYKIDLRTYRGAIKKDSYATWNMVALMLESGAKPGTIFPASYQYIDGAYATSWEKFNLKIIPAPAKVIAPKRFKVAPMFARDGSFSDSKAAKKLSEFIRDAGFNSIHGQFPKTQNEELKKAGIERNSQIYYICNGYRIGQKKKPESVLFKLADGSYRTKPREAICPVEVYTQGKYYREAVIPIIRDYLVTKDLADQIMSNWEPYMFNFKGCFCDRCKDEFVKYSKEPKADIYKAWAKDILVKYRDKWVKFRSWQHGKLVKTLEQTCQKIGKEAGKDSHFIPEVAWSALTEGGRDHFAQNDPRDYMDSLPVIEPWGPYVFFDFTRPYIYNTGIHLITYEAGKNIKKYVAKYVPNKKKRPALIAFPHGIQCDTWVTEPEAISFEMLCYFVNGWNGAFLYYMPRGYDARWWNAATEANRLISAYENLVFDGKRIDTAKVKAVSPMPSSKLPSYWREGGNFLQKIPTLANATILNTVEYKLGNKRLVAVGNFWQKAECFYNLSIPGLNANAKYAVTQPIEKRCFTATAKRRYFTGKELANGILLQVGALRWSFYVIEPYHSRLDTGKALDQAFMKNSLKKSLPAIKKALQWEKAYQKKLNASAAKAAALPDYSNLKAISNKGVSCKIVKSSPAPTLEITSKAGKMMLAPAKGAMITSWKKDGSELVGNMTGSLCGDAFWWPKSAIAVSVIESPYKLVSQKKSANGLNIVFERVLTLADSKSLRGATLQKSYEFNANGSFKVTTKITNTKNATIRFSYRRRSISAFMGMQGSKRGKAAMGDVVFERAFTQKLYRYATKGDPDLEKSFNMDTTLITKNPSVVFSASWIKFKAKFTALDKDKLHCFVFWDSGRQKYSTFEQVFSKTTLAPGKTWQTTTRWEIK